MLAELLLPDSSDLRLDAVNVDRDDKGLTVVVTAVRPEAECPVCSHPSRRVHSRYQRSMADLPCVGVVMRLHVEVRKFFCRNEFCDRRVFAERLPGVVAPSARRTLRLADEQRQIGQELGGEAGARVAGRIGMGTSPDTLLRLVRRNPVPEAATPRALGVDDWAKRKGHTYGTILVDLVEHKVIDLLPDRSPETLAKWLQDHPGVEVISRDRAGAYADGASRGAPQAVQVADRFHLLGNLREALERLLNRNQAALYEVTKPRPVAEMASEAVQEQELAQLPEVDAAEGIVAQADPSSPPTEVEAIREGKRAWRQTRYDQVIVLHQQGVGIRAIAGQLQMSRGTVRRYLRAERFPEMAQRRRVRSILDPYKPYLHERLAAGCENAVQLWREIREQGFVGSRGVVSIWVARHRQAQRTGCTRRRGRPPAPRPEPSQRPLSARQASWLLMRRPADLKPEEEEKVRRLCEATPDIAAGYALGQGFAQMVRERKPEALDPWMNAVNDGDLPDLKRFAAGIQRDRKAMLAALSLSWSNGQTEGHVNRLKLIKRQMYGRANFDLLRLRVLAA